MFEVRLPWEPKTFIFRGFSPYIGGLKNFHFSWFWGPRVYSIINHFNGLEMGDDSFNIS